MGVFDWLRRWWQTTGAKAAASGRAGSGRAGSGQAPSPGQAPPSTLGPGRTSGNPPSGNGASSFHLFWDLPGEFVAVTADFEVVRAPSVKRLYFWALQANFVDGESRDCGGAHFGLQYHPDYPGSTAVNWGGYGQGGGELSGSNSPLVGSLGNPHTRDYTWHAGRKYRFRIELAPPADQPNDRRIAWQGSVTDLSTGINTVVRVLYTLGDRLVDPLVWSEVFARCDQPEVEVRWSGFEATDLAGNNHRPSAVRVNYQAHEKGGCANTDSAPGPGNSVSQRTNVARMNPQGSRITLDAAPTV